MFQQIVGHGQLAHVRLELLELVITDIGFFRLQARLATGQQRLTPLAQRCRRYFLLARYQLQVLTTQKAEDRYTFSLNRKTVITTGLLRHDRHSFRV